MGSVVDALSKKMEAAFYRAPDGRPFDALPWHRDPADFGLVVPWYAQPRRAPAKRLFALAALVLFVGWVAPSKVLAGIGAGVLAACAVSYRNAWFQAGAYEVRVVERKLRVHEREPVKMTFQVHNKSGRRLEKLIVRAVFPGSVESERVLVVPPLRPNERRQLVLEYPADRGMGEFQLGPLAVITCDALGLFPRCLTHSVDLSVEVVPEETTMEPLAVSVTGRTMHSGTFEAKVAGDSPTFLGLRPFRSGDSVRRIDWKRSQRHRELVVREFERLNATDATLIIDQRFVSRFEFGALNSYELLRDTAVALVKSLLDQQVRVQLITPEVEIPAGKGRYHFELLVDVIRSMEPTGKGDYPALLRQKAHLIPPDSLVVPLFSSAGIDYQALIEVVVGFVDRRVETIPVIIDAERFERRIVSEARLSAEQRSLIWVLKQKHAEDSGVVQPLDRMVERLTEKTIWIGPGETIATVHAKESKWRPRQGNV